MLSGLSKKAAGKASRNIVLKKQYTLFSFALDFFFNGSIGFNFLFRMGLPLRALRGPGRFARKKEIRQVYEISL